MPLRRPLLAESMEDNRLVSDSASRHRALACPKIVYLRNTSTQPALSDSPVLPASSPRGVEQAQIARGATPARMPAMGRAGRPPVSARAPRRSTIFNRSRDHGPVRPHRNPFRQLTLSVKRSRRGVDRSCATLERCFEGFQDDTNGDDGHRHWFLSRTGC